MTYKQDEHEPIRIRGRWFSSSDLRVIRDSVSRYYDQGRTQISKAVCVQLSWTQPNGWLKDRACRDVLIRLEDLGVLKLPPRIVNHVQVGKGIHRISKSSLEKYDLTTQMTLFPRQIELEFAKGNACEKVWNELVGRYHYLGYRPSVGRCIKYLIKSNDRLIGAISFSSPAWQLAPRDEVLRFIGLANPHEQVINNSRFLILPFVKIPNLASHALSLATKQIVKDWNWYYSLTPLVAETFVQPSLFDGVCYKAANWVEIGITKGYSKRGSYYLNSQEPKKIFLYGLNRRTRVQLRNILKYGQNSVC